MKKIYLLQGMVQICLACIFNRIIKASMRQIVLSIICFGFSWISIAQSPQTALLIEAAKKDSTRGEYSRAIQQYSQVIPLCNKDQRGYNLQAACYASIANLYHLQGMAPDSVLKYFYYSLAGYDSSKNEPAFLSVMQQLDSNLYYHKNYKHHVFSYPWLNYQPEWVSYGLKDIEKINDTLGGFYLYEGKNHYVNQGETGYLRGTGNLDARIRKDSVTGVILIDTSAANWSYGRFLTRNNESIENIQKFPDYLVIPGQIPVHDYQSFLYKAFIEGVDWKVEKETIIFLNKFIAIHYSSPFYDELIAKKIFEDFSINVPELKQNPPALILSVLEEGMYKGKTVLQVLENLQQKDVYQFLDWLRANLHLQRGNQGYLLVEFVDWLPKTPPGPNSILKEYIQANTEVQKKSIIENFISLDLPWETYASDWDKAAMKNYDHKEFKLADDITEFVYQIAVRKKDTFALARAIFQKAYVLLNRDKEAASNQLFMRAKELYKKVGSSLNVQIANRNLAFNFNRIKEYEKAEEFYVENIELAKADHDTNPSGETKERLRKAYENLASGFSNRKMFDQEISMRLLAIAFSSSREDSISNIVNLNTSYGNGNYYNQQIEWNKRLVELYTLDGDKVKVGTALNDIAYAYSHQGDNEKSKAYYKRAYRWHLEAGNIKEAAFSLSAQAQMYWSMYQKDTAIILHNAARALSETVKDTLGMAYSYTKLGTLYKETSEIEASTRAFSAAEALFLKVPLSKGFADMLSDQAENFREVKDYDKAMQYYQQSAAVYKEVGEEIYYTHKLYDIANLWSLRDKFEMAEKMYDSLVLHSQKDKDINGMLNYYYGKSGLAQGVRSDLNEALSYLYLAMDMLMKGENQKLQANMALQIGSLLSMTGKADSSLYYLELAKSIYVAQKQPSGILAADLQKGYYFMGLAEIDSATYYFKQTLETSVSIGYLIGETNAISGLINVEFFKGNYAKALEMQKAVMEKYLSLKDPWGIANSFLVMGNILNQQTVYDEAIRYYDKADSIYQEKKYLRARLTSINNPSTIYYAQGNLEKCLTLMLSCLDILKQVDDVYMKRIVTGNLGELYIDLKKFDLAQSYLDTAYNLSIQYKDKHGKYVSEWILGRLKFRTGKHKEAIQFFETARLGMLQTGEKLFLAAMHNDWGKTYLAIEQPDSAAVHFKQSVAICKDIQSDKYIWEAYAGLANIFLLKDQHTLAIHYLDSAINVVEGIKLRLSGGEAARKIFSSGESVLDLYQKMASILKKLGRNDEALLYLEKSNIENINTQLKQSHGETAEDLLAKEKQQKLNIIEKQRAAELLKPVAQQNTETIAKLEQMRTIAEKDYLVFVQDLAKKYPNRTDLQQINAREFKKERSFIPNDVALLSYLITPNELSIFIVQKDSLIIKDIPIHKALFEEKIKNYYAALSRFTGTAQRGNVKIGKPVPANISVDSLGAELYDILIAPALEALAGKKEIAIIPSGYLCFIPFQALGTREGNKMKYFGNEKSVFYVNRITGVTNGRSGALTGMKIIAVGNADNSLPFAEDEVKGIASTVPGTLSLIRDAATRKNLMAQKENFNVLHMATHGILDYNHPDSSYLVLASDTEMKDNGRLFINDIYAIEDLDQFNMVTLSACETAVSNDLVEGWPISTAAAFLEAGVSTVVASLWQVDDKATGILMKAFYNNLETMSKVQALQSAQHYLQQQPGYAHPYYWAAFQVVGLWQ